MLFRSRLLKGRRYRRNRISLVVLLVVLLILLLVVFLVLLLLVVLILLIVLLAHVNSPLKMKFFGGCCQPREYSMVKIIAIIQKSLAEPLKI